jgi:hypothetical protein
MTGPANGEARYETRIFGTIVAELKRASRSASTLLANGKVLIDSGIGGPELYDPATESFALAGPVTGCSPIGASLLINGKVLETVSDTPVVGLVVSCTSNSAAVLYDPLSGTFTPTSYSADLGLGITTPLPDGTVLITGGDNPAGILYDPASGTFTASGRMAWRRGGPSTLLPDGTVLVAGGQDVMGNFGAGASAEIYYPALLIPPPVLLPVSGSSQAAILHAATQQLVAPDNPAVGGEILEIFLTGLADGSVIPPQVAIGAHMAEVLFFGKAPGYAELNQVNVRVPSGITPGSAVSVRLTYIGRPSNEVTIAVQ